MRPQPQAPLVGEAAVSTQRCARRHVGFFQMGWPSRTIALRGQGACLALTGAAEMTARSAFPLIGHAFSSQNKASAEPDVPLHCTQMK